MRPAAQARLEPPSAGLVLAVLGFATLVGLASASELEAQGEHVANTLHNLSVSGPGEIKAVTETRVCRFCHIPHNAIVPVPLWGHALSQEQYTVPEIRTGGQAREPAPQPDGSSRLCLSCHDGTVALGKVGQRLAPIRMLGMQRLAPGDRGFLGTDLSGSHPISFELRDTVDLEQSDDLDITSRPLSEIRGNPLVRLDENDKMQCTTCHDAHSDRFYRPGEVPHFWVGPSVDAVCLSCHVPR